jgi:uncharacterized membrane protein YjjP (DUF1212 family)
MALELQPGERGADLLPLLRDLARALLKAGGSTGLIENALEQVARAKGIPCKATAQPNAVWIELDGRVTLVKGFPELLSFDAQDRLETILDQVIEGRLAPEAGRQELAVAMEAPPRYPTWVRVLGYALFSAGLGVLEQRTLRQLIVCFATGVIVGILVMAIEGRRAWTMVMPLLASALVSTLVLFGTKFGYFTGPVLLLFPSLIGFLPGDILTVGMMELVTDRMVAGATRLTYGLVRLLLLIAGTLIALDLTNVPNEQLFVAEPGQLLGAWATPFAVALFGGGMALWLGMRPASIPRALLVLFFGWIVQHLVHPWGGEVLASFAGALAIARASFLRGGQGKGLSTMALSLPAFFVLVPGDLGFWGLAQILGGQKQGFAQIGKMLMLVTAVAMGFVVGAVLGTRTGKGPKAPLGPA